MHGCCRPQSPSNYGLCPSYINDGKSILINIKFHETVTSLVPINNGYCIKKIKINGKFKKNVQKTKFCFES